MVDINFELVHRKVNPWLQFGLAIAVGLVGMVICKIVQGQGSSEYLAAMAGIILFTLINVVVSVAHTSFLRYTVPSYYIYGLLLIVLLLSAKYISGISIWKLTEYRMMLFSITLFYFIASLLVRLLRYIYEIAESDM